MVESIYLYILYIINIYIYSGCVNKLDIGELCDSSILVDDMNGDGYLDLIISTLNGNIYTFSTQSKYKPLKAITGLNQNTNIFRYSDNKDQIGVYFRHSQYELIQLFIK